MTASARERSYFARIGELKTRSHTDAAEAHRELPLAERLSRSWALFERFRGGQAAAVQTTASAQFFARARALGLHQP